MGRACQGGQSESRGQEGTRWAPGIPPAPHPIRVWAGSVGLASGAGNQEAWLLAGPRVSSVAHCGDRSGFRKGTTAETVAASEAGQGLTHGMSPLGPPS